jgi:glucose-6-phosphate 1-dehydrogenase
VFIILNMKVTDPHIVVIFGASGDLTRRKLVPALYSLTAQKLLPSNIAILGIGRTIMDDSRFRASMRESIEKYVSGYNKNRGSDEFLKKLH